MATRFLAGHEPPRPRSGAPVRPASFLERRAWLVLLGPAVVILLLTTVFPLFYSLYLSMNEWTMGSLSGWRFVGAANYRQIVHDPFVRTSIRVTAVFIIGSVGLQFVLGLGIAILLDRPLKASGLIRSVLILPTMTTPVVVGLVWRIMYNPELGMVRYILSLLGLPAVNWLGDPRIALAAVVAVDTWEWTPFMALVLLAGLSSLPRDVYESASIDGASSWGIFRHVTLPLLKPTMVVATLIRLMDAFKAFDLVFVLTRGGPGMATELLSFYTYRTGFKFFNMGYAAALSYVLLVVVILISQVFVKMLAQAAT